MARYYVDTCVWRDHFEERQGLDGRPLGENATIFFTKVIHEKHVIIFSNHLLYELKRTHNTELLIYILRAAHCLEKISATEEQKEEAERMSVKRRVGVADCLHAILARDSKSVLITQNIRDFKHFSDFLEVRRP